MNFSDFCSKKYSYEVSGKCRQCSILFFSSRKQGETSGHEEGVRYLEVNSYYRRATTDPEFFKRYPVFEDYAVDRFRNYK